MNEPVHAQDNPGVIALPPLIAFVTLVAGVVLDRLVPIGAANAILPRSGRFIIAGVLLALAGWIVSRAVRMFQRVGTNLDVRKPSLALATEDIYTRTRNPMYQALGILLLAFAVGLASDWTVLLLVPWTLVMHFGVVLREERYLAGKFGDAYRRYMTEVPRYGWPL
jgi:protein-S-isoprenylcysteine O-methyltransferase Ste14